MGIGGRRENKRSNLFNLKMKATGRTSVEKDGSAKGEEERTNW